MTDTSTAMTPEQMAAQQAAAQAAAAQQAGMGGNSTAGQWVDPYDLQWNKTGGADMGAVYSNPGYQQAVAGITPGYTAGSQSAPSGQTGSKTPDGTGSAVAILQGVLQQYGLSDLSDWAINAIKNGESTDQVLLELRNQPAFKTRFPAIFDRQAKGLPPISPTDYVNYEATASQLFQQYGLPNGMTQDKTIIEDLLGSDVSATELKDRLDQGFSAVENGPQTVQDAFSRYYGVQGKAALASMFLDPTRAEPALLKMSNIAQIGGEAGQYGLNIGLNSATKVNDAGISSYQRHADFVQANSWRPLENQTLGEANAGALAQTDDTLTGAAFGTDPTQQLAVNNLLRQRNSAVQNLGSDSVATSTGQVGLGASQPVG